MDLRSLGMVGGAGPPSGIGIYTNAGSLSSQLAGEGVLKALRAQSGMVRMYNHHSAPALYQGEQA